MNRRSEEIRTATLWFGGALLVVTLTGYGIYRAGRRILRGRRVIAGAR